MHGKDKGIACARPYSLHLIGLQASELVKGCSLREGGTRPVVLLLGDHLMLLFEESIASGFSRGGGSCVLLETLGKERIHY